MGIEGHNKLESFGFWRRKFCIKNAEILSVGKIAEFAKFAGGQNLYVLYAKFPPQKAKRLQLVMPLNPHRGSIIVFATVICK